MSFGVEALCRSIYADCRSMRVCLPHTPPVILAYELGKGTACRSTNWGQTPAKLCCRSASNCEVSQVAWDSLPGVRKNECSLCKRASVGPCLATL